jgi:hypothetical protein
MSQCRYSVPSVIASRSEGANRAARKMRAACPNQSWLNLLLTKLARCPAGLNPGRKTKVNAHAVRAVPLQKERGTGVETGPARATRPEAEEGPGLATVANQPSDSR